MTTQQEQNTQNRIFIIGIVYNENERGKKVIEALSLYDRQEQKGYLQSFERVQQRFKNGEPIVGMRIKTVARFLSDEEDYKITTYPVLDAQRYDHRKLNVLNGNGDIVEQGRDVVIGKINGNTNSNTNSNTNNTEEKYVVVDSNYGLRYLSKEETLSQKLVGTLNGGVLKESKEPMQTKFAEQQSETSETSETTPSIQSLAVG